MRLARKGASHPSLRWSLVTLVLLAGCTSSGSVAPARSALDASSPPSATEPARAVGSWRRISEAPIPPAGGMAAAWTGRQLVVWGGQVADGHRPAAEGAAYEPAADRWERLPPTPIAGRFGASAVWTGREVLLWGGQGGPGTTFADGAGYDPVTRRWRVLPAAPIGARTSHQAVWTGKEMVVWGGFGRCCPIDSVIHDPATAAYDPVTDRWRRIAEVPPPWSGDDGSAVTVAHGDRPMVWRRGRLAVYDDVVGQWAEVPGAPTPPDLSGELVAHSTDDPLAYGVVAGGELFTWTGPRAHLAGVAYRPSATSDGSWRRTASLDAQSGAAVAAGGPDRIYAAPGQSARVLAYRMAEDRWEELPPPPISTRSAAVLVWTGSGLLFWGGAGDEGPEMDGAIWHCC